MKFRLTVPTVLTVLSFGLSSLALSPAQKQDTLLTSPQQYFGFQLGTDRRMARWDEMVNYYRRLESESNRIRVVDMGPTSMGNPFLLVMVTSPDNFSQLEQLREVNLKISDPRTIPEAELEALIGRGKAVVAQSMSLHATEIGGSQMAPELAFDLVARDDEETLRILENVILLMFPSFNPDGQIMVTDWYRKYVGTEYEGVGLPWLYHKYAGHDNNRDGDFINLVESEYAARILYRDWKPQAYVDHHHMGSYGARLYVPPYSEPLRPYADPLLWRELSWFGGHIAYKLEEAGKQGVLNAAQYPGWGHFGWHWITPFHNIAGMLTESASASLATPLYIHPDQLRGGARGFPEYEPQSNMPNPWQGGWWRLRDIVEQQKISAWAILDMAARNRETLLRNAALKAKRQTERGASQPIKAYVIPSQQHDPLTAIKMIDTLLLSDVEIFRATRQFQVGEVLYGAGSFVIPLAQPKMGLVRNLLGQTLYPDNEWTRDRSGDPLRPYDSATHTMAEFMGVRVDSVKDTIPGDLQKVSTAVRSPGTVNGSGSIYRLDGRFNDSFKAVNLLMDQGVTVDRLDAPSGALAPGDFIVSGTDRGLLAEAATASGVNFEELGSKPAQGLHPVRRLRVAMYQRYRGGNMDEGWTRLLFEKFSFPYTPVMDAEIKQGNLNQKFDALILPDDNTATLMGEQRRERTGGREENYPAEYRSGLGSEGVDSIKEFIAKGGILIALGEATEFAIEKLELSVRNSLSSLSSKEFFCPGSTLHVRIDNNHPLAYGMPSEGLVLFWDSPAFEIVPTRFNEKIEPVVTYRDRDILRSGWLLGEQHLGKKAGMVLVRSGEGEVILIGFRTQHRAQTHGTFKLLFNALLR